MLIGCSSSSDPAPASTKPKGIVDGDGNVYTSVTIGSQTWLTSDLKARHYLDGAAVQGYATYYYKWADLSDFKGLCPNGYRIATEQDFAALVSHYSGNAVALLADFKPGVSGYFDANGIFFSNLPNHYFYWSSNGIDATTAYNFMISDVDTPAQGTADKNQGFCVRCIKK